MDKIKIFNYRWAIWEDGKILRRIRDGEIRTQDEMLSVNVENTDWIFRMHVKQDSKVAWIK